MYCITIALKLYVSIYIVDNMDICKHHPKLFEMVVYLNQEFEVTIGSLDCYVGLHICSNHELHVIYIDQTTMFDIFFTSLVMMDPSQLIQH